MIVYAGLCALFGDNSSGILFFCHHFSFPFIIEKWANALCHNEFVKPFPIFHVYVPMAVILLLLLLQAIIPQGSICWSGPPVGR